MTMSGCSVSSRATFASPAPSAGAAAWIRARTRTAARSCWACSRGASACLLMLTRHSTVVTRTSQRDVPLVHHPVTEVPRNLTRSVTYAWPTAAVFDFDGLLVDTSSCWRRPTTMHSPNRDVRSTRGYFSPSHGERGIRRGAAPFCEAAGEWRGRSGSGTRRRPPRGAVSFSFPQQAIVTRETPSRATRNPPFPAGFWLERTGIEPVTSGLQTLRDTRRLPPPAAETA